MTFAEWMRDNMAAQDVWNLAEHGASSGIPGLTYYSETLPLYERFSDEAWEAAREDASDFGASSTLAFVANLGGGNQVETADQFANLMVWYLAEREARAFVDANAICSECGNWADNGEGWNGRCGECADRADRHDNLYMLGDDFYRIVYDAGGYSAGIEKI